MLKYFGLNGKNVVILWAYVTLVKSTWVNGTDTNINTYSVSILK